MNKIIVEQEEIKLKEDVVIESFTKSKVIFHIDKNVNCGILSLPEDGEIEIYLHDGALFNLDLFVRMKDDRNKIKIYSGNETQLNIQYACLFEGKNVLTILNEVKNNQTKTNITIHAVELDGTIEIKAEGCIKEQTISNEYSENIKVLTKSNHHVTIMPNLKVFTNDVIANHNAVIAPVSEKDLFYLESKGIRQEHAEYLIKSGFLKGILKFDEIKQEVIF